MAKRNFKVGDKVRRTGVDFGGLKVGEVYVVTGVAPDGVHIYTTGLREPGPAASSRFELVLPLDQEADPNGIDQHAPGAKLDAGKDMAAQILGQFPLALEAVAEVGTFGARKYTLGGWQHVIGGIVRYADAGMRHWLKRMAGETHDPDSKMLHLKHEAWNKLAELELTLREQKKAT